MDEWTLVRTNKRKVKVFLLSCDLFFFLGGWRMMFICEIDEQIEEQKKGQSFYSSLPSFQLLPYVTTFLCTISVLDKAFLGDAWRFTNTWMNELLQEQKKGQSFSSFMQSFFLFLRGWRMMLYCEIDEQIEEHKKGQSFSSYLDGWMIYGTSMKIYCEMDEWTIEEQKKG